MSSVAIKVLSTTALNTAFEELTSQIEHATGQPLAIELGPSLQLEKRLGEGAVADLVIVSAAGAADLAAKGILLGASITPIAGSALGVAVRTGAAKPDISTADAFKQAVLSAKSVAVSKPVGGGQSGVHMAKVFERLGIADAVATKVKYGAGGPTGLVGLIVVRGDADIGVQQLSELMAVPGIDVVGPLPAELQNVTPFVAAIPARASRADAGRAVIAFLQTAEAKRVLRAKGLEPA